MAAKVKKAKGAAKTAKVVTVADIAEEFGVSGRKVRMVARGLGLKAPETGTEGFGPKAKYEWNEGSKELKQLREALKGRDTSSKPKASKAKAKEAEPEVEEEEFEDEEEDDEGDEEEEEDDD